jgi:hypothetical protein
VLPALFSVDGSRYQIMVDLSTQTALQSGALTIDIAFSTSFVPASLGINPDTRELVVRGPDSVRAIPVTPSP